ncbi:MAG: hypothetical protein IKR26_02985 [Lachnospiraceae bacterium]|nr:hypothetical protein [Lachnospiraceae bacterium]
MKTIFKKMLCLIVAMFFLCGLAACGEDGKETSAATGSATEPASESAAAVESESASEPADFRSIMLYYVDGRVQILRGDTVIPFTKDMPIKSGDRIITLADSRAFIMLDDDKFFMLEPASELEITADGSAQSGSASVNLLFGAVCAQFDAEPTAESPVGALINGASAEVNAKVFRLALDAYTGKGEAQTDAFTGLDDYSAAFLGAEKDATGGEKTPEKPASKTGSGKKSKKSASDSTIAATTAAPTTAAPKIFTVTFRYEGKTFYTVKVKEGEKVKAPSLSPAPTGGWDYDFSRAVTGNAVIDWK